MGKQSLLQIYRKIYLKRTLFQFGITVCLCIALWILRVYLISTFILPVPVKNEEIEAFSTHYGLEGYTDDTVYYFTGYQQQRGKYKHYIYVAELDGRYIICENNKAVTLLGKNERIYITPVDNVTDQTRADARQYIEMSYKNANRIPPEITFTDYSLSIRRSYYNGDKIVALVMLLGLMVYMLFTLKLMVSLTNLKFSSIYRQLGPYRERNRGLSQLQIEMLKPHFADLRFILTEHWLVYRDDTCLWVANLDKITKIEVSEIRNKAQIVIGYTVIYFDRTKQVCRRFIWCKQDIQMLVKLLKEYGIDVVSEIKKKDCE